MRRNRKGETHALETHGKHSLPDVPHAPGLLQDVAPVCLLVDGVPRRERLCEGGTDMEERRRGAGACPLWMEEREGCRPAGVMAGWGGRGAWCQPR